MSEKVKIGFIGTGKVGSSLARLLDRAGYPITAIHNRTLNNAENLSRYLPDVTVVSNPVDVVVKSDVIFLTVADDAVELIAEQIKASIQAEQIVVHTSGAKSIKVLQPLAENGAMIGSLHPVFPFADVESAIENISGATFAIETESPNVQCILSELVTAIDCQYFVIPEGKKALYHAALVIASNYTVTLYAIAESILAELGANHEVASNALNGLVSATVKNIQQQGIPDALTGPLVRADVGTIKEHLSAIDDDNLLQVYIGLAQLSYPMLQARQVDITPIQKLFEDEK